MRHIKPLILVCGVCLFAVLPAPGAPSPAAAAGRSRLVGGWLVERWAESDGGRIVRMTQRGRGFLVRYQAVFWRGNYRPIRTLDLRDGSCRAAGNLDALEPGFRETPQSIRTGFNVALEDCGTSVRRQAQMFAGLDRSAALFLSWVAAAEAATAAENEEIFNQNRAPAAERR